MTNFLSLVTSSSASAERFESLGLPSLPLRFFLGLLLVAEVEPEEERFLVGLARLASSGSVSSSSLSSGDFGGDSPDD